MTSTMTLPQASSIAANPAASGWLLHRKYQVEGDGPLGRGSMGVVWLVRHRELGCLRALKTIPAALAADRRARLQFRREARALAALAGHPNAVAVHDARLGRAGGYIEMEYVAGRDLKALLQPGRPMGPAWAARIVPQLCDVIDSAHEAGIVHRDLKPANLMVHAGSPEGQSRLKVVDFGLAGILSGPGGSAGDRAFGSPAYASPEQLAGAPVGPSGDIYSLGVILYEILTGYLPFEGPLPRLLSDTAATPPPRPSSRNPEAEISANLERLVLDCLAKAPNARPRSAREVADRFLAA